jgi:hypothetical protein
MKKNLLVFVIAIFGCVFANGQEKEMKDVNLDDLIEETQFSNESTDDLEMVWWMPVEYWEVVFAKEQAMDDSEMEMITKMLEDYILVIVVKGKFGLFGGITYESRDDILNSLKLYYNGSALKHVAEEKLSPDLKNFMMMIGPMMKNMLGQMGENMQFFAYENKGKDRVNVRKKGTLSFELGDYTAQSDLPLGSLIQEKQCPVSKKLYNGKWFYCPIHGKELVAQEN